MGSSYSAIELRPHGGEGGIRTPDTREGMHDFESCAFNQALPPLLENECVRYHNAFFESSGKNNSFEPPTLGSRNFPLTWRLGL